MALGDAREVVMRRVFVMLFVCVAPAVASAQPGHIEIEPPPTSERWFASVDVGMTVVRGERFSNSHQQPNQFLPSFNETFKVDYDLGLARGGNFGFGVMATPRLAFGVTRTRVKYSSMLLATEVRWPLLIRSGSTFRVDRIRVNTDSSYSQRVEQAYHLEASAVLVRRTAVVLRGFAGPTWFDISQGFVRALDRVDATVDHETTIDGAGWGYHAGLDFAVYMPTTSRTTGIGVGTSVRYSRGSIGSINALDPADGPQAYSTGGWYVSVGMRGRF
jgi:hypothetical protein